MKYIKSFESIKSEFPVMFAPIKPEDEPQQVPGFESGTIDPSDDEFYNFEGKGNIQISDAESYIKFLKITKERNFIETSDEIKINIKKLYEDFYMTVFNNRTYFKQFLESELIGKYVSDGYLNMFDDKTHGNYKGIIEKVYIMYDGYSAFVNFDLKNQKLDDGAFCENVITIDKLKSSANKYNL